MVLSFSDYLTGGQVVAGSNPAVSTKSRRYSSFFLVISLFSKLIIFLSKIASTVFRLGIRNTSNS